MLVAQIIGGIGGHYFLDGYLLMLLVPTFTSWTPDYWQAVAAVIAARTLQRPLLNIDTWTRSATEFAKGQS